MVPAYLFAGTVTMNVGGTGSINIRATGAGSVYTGNTAPTGGGGGGGGALDDVLFYWGMDSAALNQSPQKGAVNSITIDAAGFTLQSPAQVGDGLKDNNIGNKAVRISTTSNLDFSKGRMGFYFHFNEIASGTPMWATLNTAPYFIFRWNTGTQFQWRYKDKTTTYSSFVSGSTYFIELAWDSAETTLGAPCRIYVNGVNVSSCSGGSTGSDPSVGSGTFKLSGFDGNTTDGWYDQLLISNDPTRDLYAIRDQTSF